MVVVDYVGLVLQVLKDVEVVFEGFYLYYGVFGGYWVQFEVFLVYDFGVKFGYVVYCCVVVLGIDFGFGGVGQGFGVVFLVLFYVVGFEFVQLVFQYVIGFVDGCVYIGVVFFGMNDVVGYIELYFYLVVLFVVVYVMYGQGYVGVGDLVGVLVEV